jgi:putative transferase (TIGR04331 family)
MFLATTAIEEFWDKASKILFLGPWCIPDKICMESIDSTGNKMVPSPWYPPAKRIDAFNYCHSLYEMAITKLSLRLNKLHGVSYPDKYWRILIGPWLLHYITVLFDRYKRLKKALDTFPSFYTYVLPKEKCSLVSYSTDDFMFGGFWKVRDDLYNHFLFSIIAHEICPENIIERDCGYEIKANVIRRGWKRKIFNVLKSPIDKGFRGYILLDEMYHISLKELFMLKVKTGFNRLNFVEMFGSSLPDNMLLIDKYSKDMRATLKIDCTGDEFESILFKVVPEAIPICYIEDYRYHKNKIKTMNNLKFIGSLVGWNYNETFKLYSAESKLNGAKLVEFQHGGGYGSSPIGPMNTLAYEKDVFYSWGWTDKKRKNIKPLPSPYLSRLIDSYSYNIMDNNIVLVGTKTHKYLKRFDSYYFSDDIVHYFNNKKDFLGALLEKIRKNIIYRPGKEVGWQEINCIRKSFPEIQYDVKRRLIDLMRKAKITIIDHPGTSYLEALVINVPTVLYWDHDICFMRPEAEPYFQALRDVGILYKGPVSAARKVNEIFDDPMEWWHSNTVQNARKEFCDRFAYARKDWLDVWVRELRKFI